MKIQKTIKTVAIAMLVAFAVSLTGCASMKRTEPMTKEQHQKTLEEYREMDNM
jgi:Flp pilus assembly protein TadD